MQHVLHQLIQPTAVLLLFVILYCLSGPVWTDFRRGEGQGPGLWALLWLVLAVAAFLSWLFFVTS